ncbi:type II secretion system secretin GspD [Porticoccus sp. W117]|uniref:type II secretion system secretin GspD n=1 Tax=Porticoccus sp. W117 TaxID=3054777 RepID=UPI002594B884|nr:type II secretion system secretin GspD [Porticoccus sp. W117]MDM3872571.1 type II secretion system secretin GspD [Porticoccus sp. W117]
MVNKLHQLLLITLCVAIPVPSAFAQQGSGSSNDKGIMLALDNADVIDLIRWAQDVTQKNIILHPNVKGRVTVLAGDSMTREEAYRVFLSVLEVHGLAVIDSGESLKVIPIAGAKTSSLPMSKDGKLLAGEELVVKVIKVKNISANNLLNLLRPLIPQSGYVAAYPQTNMLIVAERASKIAQVMDIVQSMDKSGVIDIELITLEFASAREVSDVVTKLLPKQSGESAANAFNLAVDERSNSILMTGDPVSRQQIRSLIQRLDQPLQGQGNTQVIRIQYATAADLVPLLQSVSGSEQKKSKDQGLADVAVSIEPHDQLNALVITAPPSLLATMKGVIKELDVPRAQVLVEALIVEVNEDLAHNLGIQWTADPPSGNTDVIGGFRNFPSGLTPLSLGEDGAPVLGSGLSFGYLKNNDLRLIINALAGETNANILSTPTIVALDNEEASILVGSTVPFLTGQQQRPGDLNTFNTIQREDIGLSLTVTPRVNNNNSVTLAIDQSVESITQSPVETADIVTNKREIKTQVLIGDDQVLVLGGLMRDEFTETENKVPLLGSVPLLGRLFRSTSITATKANLLVFIHPRILHNSATLESYSSDRYNEMRERQLQFDKNTERFFILKDKPLLPKIKKLKPAQSDREPPTTSAENKP